VVTRGLPFHFTTEAGTNPAPFTVRVNADLPGAVASGASGWSTKGTGFWAEAVVASVVKTARAASIRGKVLRMRTMRVRVLVVMGDLLGCYGALTFIGVALTNFF
jgi:hypothetical protein